MLKSVLYRLCDYEVRSGATGAKRLYVSFMELIPTAKEEFTQLVGEKNRNVVFIACLLRRNGIDCAD